MKRFTILLMVMILGLLAACGDNEDDDDLYDLAALEVDFIVPESAEVGELVTLEAIVTYGDEYVEEADEVLFEYWVAEEENTATDEEHHEHDADFDLQDGSTTIEGEHVGDGSYQAEVIFNEEGVYELYAHTTAEGLHTMPLESITVEATE